MANLTAPEIALPSPARVAANEGRREAAPVQINPSSWQEVLAVWVGRVVTAAAFWSLISIPLHGWNVADWVDRAFWIVNIPVSPSLFTVVLLTLLGNALRRRLRFGLLVLVFFQALSAVIGVAAAAVAIAQTQHADVTVDVNNQPTAVLIVEGCLGLALAVLLWRLRPNFPARLAPGSRVRALLVLLLGLAISAVVSIALVQAFPHTLREGSERTIWALRIVIGLTPPDGSSAFHGHSGYHWVTTIVGAISALALAGAAVVFLRSARLTRYLSAADELDVRRLLLESGERDSLGYFATRRDKSVVFAPDRRAVISYRVVASVSLASGDPIGELAAWPNAITAWLAEARRFGWFPAALSASEAGARAYVRAGLHALSIGDEAVIHVDEFSLSDRAMAPVRKAVNRLRRAGYTIQVRRQSELSQPERAELADRAEQWRGDETERGFSMALGRLGDETDQRCVMVTAHDGAGAMRGLLSFVPWGMRGLSLDLMRRDRTAENGITEFMVAGLVDASPDLGVRRISLNFAMFREVFQAAERVGAGPVLRLTNAMLSVASRFWQLESLYRSNAKYLPEWVPRFLCYDSSLTLTRTVIASGMAEGFLPAPYPAVRRDADDRVGERFFVDVATEQDERLVRPVVPRQRLTQQQRVRRAKIERLAAAGVAAYPVRVPRTVRAAELRARYRDLPPATATGHTGVAVTGRVRALRDFGGLCFAVVQDDGVPFQIMLTRDRLGAERHQLWRHCIDLGDLVSVTGEVVSSRHGELSLLASDWTIAAKCLRPLPDLHSGFSDPDARVRQRYLDLIVNARSRDVLENASWLYSRCAST
jgi:lysyl-tRNA synthetase, class II